MSAHTPGPWHRNIAPARKYVVVWSGRNKHVAKLITDGLSDEECEANINLIAAAPDLLEALKGMLEVYGVNWCDVRGDTRTSNSEVELSEMARAAVAKATGEKA